MVPVIFTEETVSAIKLLVRCRSSTYIDKSNNFLFACGLGKNRLRGWDTIQGITKNIQLINPKLLTPTRTRKYLSTILQLLDMTESELTWVTNHLGHTKDIHKGWYRQEDSTIELTKIAKVLVAIDNGDSRDVQNKKIDTLIAGVNDSCMLHNFGCLFN